MSDYLKSLREAEQVRYVAKPKAAGVSLQDNPYALGNDGRFPQAGLRSVTLFSDRRSILRSNSFPRSS